MCLACEENIIMTSWAKHIKSQDSSLYSAKCQKGMISKMNYSFILTPGRTRLNIMYTDVDDHIFS